VDLLPTLQFETILLADAVGNSTRFAGAARASRGGKETIDHSPGARDDIANVVAGVAHGAVNRHTVKVTELRL
jgi:hypothetical protein